MLFYLHYILLTSGLSGTSVLLAVYFKTYTDASQGEIGTLLMSFPFVCLIIKPLFCSMADRQQAHRIYFITGLFIMMLGYIPFVIIPFFPDFYQSHPRIAWYTLVLSCHIGNGALGVAWSLGDCLAVNYSQKTGTPFGRMRLMGTLSFGVYGFIIGQINEMPMLPKYLPAFIILHLSLIIEITVCLLWNKEDFEMIDPMAAAKGQNTPIDGSVPKGQRNGLNEEEKHMSAYDYMNSMPSSLSGTLRLQPKVANVFREVLATDELHRRLKMVESNQPNSFQFSESRGGSLSKRPNQEHLMDNLEAGQLSKTETSSAKQKNPQLFLLKMILLEDGRVTKYIVLFTIFGMLVAPINFLFVSMEELCNERGYNFSQLAGGVLVSQAFVETIAFLVVPWSMRWVPKSVALSFALLVMSGKWVFYSGWYYTSGVSPYWAVLSEWSHGISYGVFCTIQAEVSLMFANQSRLFIPELRKMGFLSDVETTSKERIEAEERSIKMALRATMQALFGGFMDGLGQGAGALLCGFFIEMYSYIAVWRIFAVITFGSIFMHLLVELTRSRWSDHYKPRKGTKAFEIMELSRAYEAEAVAKLGGKPKQQANTVANKQLNGGSTIHENKTTTPAAGC